MIDRDTRIAILKLAEQGHGKRAVARAVGVSRNTVKRVLEDGRSEVPALPRPEILDPHVDEVRRLHGTCGGNLVRVHEELLAAGVDVAYPTLTSFCRRHGIGTKDKRRAGRYHFEPGEEMQHDTSPHEVTVGGVKGMLQCASIVLCHSRRQYARLYPRWSRLECRSFLAEGIEHLGGAAERAMIDNSSVVIAHGTGKDAVPAPAMKALADRFGFAFAAHEVGDADRSARVERPFHHIENNFYKGRTFADLADLNAQLLEWCDRNFHRFRKRLQASPADLYVAEQPLLKPLPAYLPEVYELHRRRVDVEGYVNLHTNRYSVDTELIGRHLEVRETVDQVRLFDGHRLAEEHDKRGYGARERITLDKHKGLSRRRRGPEPPTPQEDLLRAQGDEIARLVDALRRRHGGRAVKAVRRLHRIWTDYPTEAVRGAVSVALGHGLTDLDRIERMVLRRVAGDFFRLPVHEEDPDG